MPHRFRNLFEKLRNHILMTLLPSGMSRLGQWHRGATKIFQFTWISYRFLISLKFLKAVLNFRCFLRSWISSKHRHFFNSECFVMKTLNSSSLPFFFSSSPVNILRPRLSSWSYYRFGWNSSTSSEYAWSLNLFKVGLDQLSIHSLRCPLFKMRKIT